MQKILLICGANLDFSTLTRFLIQKFLSLAQSVAHAFKKFDRLFQKSFKNQKCFDF